MIFNVKERKVRNHVCSLFYNMIVLDWLMGSNILEELASSPTALKMEAASSMKRLYMSCTSLHGVMSQKTGIFIRIRVRTSNLTNLFIAFFFPVQNSCTRLSFQQKNCHNFVFSPCHSNHYCCFSFPNLVQDSQTIIRILPS
jgi:hypothetical protein